MRGKQPVRTLRSKVKTKELKIEVPAKKSWNPFKK